MPHLSATGRLSLRSSGSGAFGGDCGKVRRSLSFDDFYSITERIGHIAMRSPINELLIGNDCDVMLPQSM